MAGKQVLVWAPGYLTYGHFPLIESEVAVMRL